MYLYGCIRSGTLCVLPLSSTHRIRRSLCIAHTGCTLILSLLFCICFASQPEEDTGSVAGYSTSTVSGSIDTDTGPGNNGDIVQMFLYYVEKIESNIDHCKKGTWEVSLDRGAVSYGPSRYKMQAHKTVDWANFYTRIWKNSELSKIDPKEELFFNAVVSIVENDDDIFAAGNCYDYKQFRDYDLFCPYAYRLPDGMINVKDLSVEYKYLSNESEWFYEARRNAQQLLVDREPIKGNL